MSRTLGLGIICTIGGATLLALCVTGTLDSSLYAGFGGALAAIGILKTIQGLRYERDPAYRETTDIQASDERNQFLRTQSWTLTGPIVTGVEAVGAVVALVLGNQLTQTVLAFSVCLIVGTYWVTYMVLNRRY